MRPGKALAALVTLGVLGVAVMAACTQAESPTPVAVVPNVPALQTMEAASMAEPQIVRVEYPGNGGGQQNGLWANGHGQVKVAPDLAFLEVGVRVTEPTVAEANAEAASALTAMIDVLRSSGLEDADIQTSSLDIRQETQGREVTRCPEPETDADAAMSPAAESPAAPAPAVSIESAMERAMTSMVAGLAMGVQDECYTTYEQVVTGYRVSQELTAKVRDLDSIGGLIDQLVEAGGDLTRINGINFTVEDPSPLMEEAREEAIKDLLDRAQAMADAAGVGLGALEFLSESGARVLDAREESYARALPAAMVLDSGGVSTPVSAGEITVTANVSGRFYIAEE